MYVPCRGTPFRQDLPHLSTMCPREDICRSSMQPTIRAGRSHLPCGTIGRARLAEKMGGKGSGNANKDKASSYWRSVQQVRI